MASIGQIIKKYVLAPFGNKGTELPVNEIPLDMTTIPNQMSWNQGIPKITAEPIKDDGTGGIPSRGGDHAGLHNVWSTVIYASQLGILPNEYDSRMQTDDLFGGYPAGAIIAYPAGASSSKSYYLSLKDNNKDLPTVVSSWKNILDTFSFARFLPNWNAPQARAVNTTYTATSNGWVQWHGGVQSGDLNLTVNGYVVGSTSDSGGRLYENSASLTPIKTGDIYRLSSTGEFAVYSYHFFPLN